MLVTRRRTNTRTIALALTAVLSLAIALFGASSAIAGSWIRTTCLAPPYVVFQPNEGWSSFSAGTGYGSNNSIDCSIEGMKAYLSTAAAVPVGGYQALVYTPPPGSTLNGGEMFVDLLADGGGVNASGVAAVYTPAFAHDGSNVVMQCAWGLGPCSVYGTNRYFGSITLPTGRGGNLYVVASCGGTPGHVCNAHGSEGMWAGVRVFYANLLLASTNTPTGSDFRGSLLQPGAHGTASLSFNAAVVSGPGIYNVTVTIDGKAVYNANPNTNAGKCVPVGTDPPTGTLMFGYQQPCLRSQTVDLTISTRALRDGEHELKIVLGDAAQNMQTILRQTITTDNRTTTSSTLTSNAPGAGRGGGEGPPEPIYALVLDKGSQALSRGVRRSWRRSSLTLSGALRNSTGTPVPGVAMTLLGEYAGQTARAVLAHTTTDAGGRWVLTAPRGPSRRLTVVYGAGAQSASALGGVTIREIVTPGLSLTVRAIGKGQLRFTGRLSIKPLGTPRPLVIIKARRGRTWQSVGQPVRVDGSGAFRLVYDAADYVGGSYAFRATAPGTSLFDTGISPVRRQVVR